MSAPHKPSTHGARRRNSWVPVAALLAVGIAGCSRSAPQLPVVQVSGKVSVDGEKPEGAQVTLHPLSGPAADAQVRPLGKVNSDGTFRLTTYKSGDGAPSGEYAVTVQWQVLEYPDGEDADPKLGPNLVDEEYANPQQTPLRVTVAAGAGELAPIEVPRQLASARRSNRSYEE
ncbi:MAG: hypothetical protein K1X74_06410 [Pirellulales bacterium]|nr:hypothetical protein [Pirellulales bacterium]